MLQLPSSYSKDRFYASVVRESGPVELVKKLAESKVAYDRLDKRTFNRHLSALSKIWPWAQKEDIVPGDLPFIFDGHHTAKARKKDADYRSVQDLRPMWPREALEQLFSSPLFVGCESRRKSAKQGNFVHRSERYWMPILGAHQGMRREELAQLRVEHVRKDEESGIWHFDLRADLLVLKDCGSPRWVPLHDNVLRLLFLEAQVYGREPNHNCFQR
jgi:integrase